MSKLCVISGFAAIYMRSALSGILRSVQWQFLTDVPGQPTGPILKGPTERIFVKFHTADFYENNRSKNFKFG